MDGKVSLAIDDLRIFPEFIPTIAVWHHEEWAKGLPEKVNIEQRRLGILSRDISEREHSLREHIQEKPVPSTFIAHVNNQPVGSVSIVSYKFSREQHPSHWLTNLYVVDIHRRQGLGERLIDHAINFSRDHGLNSLQLYTRNLDGYYRKRGWQFSHEGVVQGQSVSVYYKQLDGAS